ncbi:MAG: NAD(P)/FAD-dependent oxidoreductase [Actinomycetota bacterium]|nr:MAG: NAD(P)/FAD-dependent oxidoreductase [Actinomycetota bacterium]
MSEKVNITIIGAGVIGCAIAYRIANGGTGSKDIVVVERNSQINGENQSSRNSGVIHAGVYYPKNIGPLKAKLCVEGNRMLYDFCTEYNIPHKKCGKLIVATDSLEEEYLEDVYSIARNNGVPGLEIIYSKRIRNFEPNIYGSMALYVPTSGVVEATALVNRLYRLAEESGVMFLVGNRITRIGPYNEGFEVTMESANSEEVFRTEILINSAGLYADEIARSVNPGCPYRMDPVKGESAKFYKSSRDNLSMNGLNIYPVPFGYMPGGEKLRVGFSEFKKLFDEGKVYKSVGVHLTPTFELVGNEYIIGDTVTVGPAYSAPENREDYAATREPAYYNSMINPFFPNIRLEDISLHQAGIRARLAGHYDFVIERDPVYKNLINLIGMDSPGLTASLAIADHIVKMIY